MSGLGKPHVETPSVEHETFGCCLIAAGHDFVLVLIDHNGLIASGASSAGALARPAPISTGLAGQHSRIDPLPDDLAKYGKVADHASYVSIDRATFGRFCDETNIVGRDEPRQRSHRRRAPIPIPRTSVTFSCEWTGRTSLPSRQRDYASQSSLTWQQTGYREARGRCVGRPAREDSTAICSATC
jgi:hypothetical protein